MQNHETVTILLVEDDELDVEIFRRSLRKNRVTNELVVASDGVEALEVLRGEAPNGSPLQRPYLVVLDVNMPRMNGLEFLQELRKDEKLHDSVVFVLTTSSDQRDIYEAYNYNVAGYIVKSEIGNSFMQAIDLLDVYWKTISLPLGHMS